MRPKKAALQRSNNSSRVARPPSTASWSRTMTAASSRTRDGSGGAAASDGLLMLPLFVNGERLLQSVHSLTEQPFAVIAARERWVKQVQWPAANQKLKVLAHLHPVRRPYRRCLTIRLERVLLDLHGSGSALLLDDLVCLLIGPCLAEHLDDRP